MKLVIIWNLSMQQSVQMIARSLKNLILHQIVQVKVVYSSAVLEGINKTVMNADSVVHFPCARTHQEENLAQSL